ncbi:venom allergen-1 isoform X1 [Drosophila bipectinata]|uniref:venom allergen-1 isoform X1 n=1 Tax=Drosophila bipectinata TaxID=42026 RepID=UPI0007E7604C|nr:antigen 5 like allergen Cul n 1 isoform X1 [Drosophila bipectinata]
MKHYQFCRTIYNLLLVIGATLSPLSAQNYCDSDLCLSGRHIACQNTGRFASGCSGEFVQINEHIQLILQLHNERRNLISGGGISGFTTAVRMGTMSWDQTLSELAAYNALQCRMAHDECRNTNTYKFSGQNLSILFTRNTEIPNFLRQRISSWFEESRYATSADMENYQMRGGPPIGHFTTMVNERNNRVGCAILRFTDNRSVQATLLVCNYAVTNVINNPVYRGGSPASDCISGRNPGFPNLCSSTEVYNYNQWSN